MLKTVSPHRKVLWSWNKNQIVANEQIKATAIVLKVLNHHFKFKYCLDAHMPIYGLTKVCIIAGQPLRGAAVHLHMYNNYVHNFLHVVTRDFLFLCSSSQQSMVFTAHTNANVPRVLHFSVFITQVGDSDNHTTHTHKYTIDIL